MNVTGPFGELPEPEPGPVGKKPYIVIHRHALWLCFILTLVAGLVWGFLIGVWVFA